MVTFSVPFSFSWSHLLMTNETPVWWAFSLNATSCVWGGGLCFVVVLYYPQLPLPTSTSPSPFLFFLLFPSPPLRPKQHNTWPLWNRFRDSFFLKQTTLTCQANAGACQCCGWPCCAWSSFWLAVWEGLTQWSNLHSLVHWVHKAQEHSFKISHQILVLLVPLRTPSQLSTPNKRYLILCIRLDKKMHILGHDFCFGSNKIFVFIVMIATVRGVWHGSGGDYGLQCITLLSRAETCGNSGRSKVSFLK